MLGNTAEYSKEKVKRKKIQRIEVKPKKRRRGRQIEKDYATSGSRLRSSASRSKKEKRNNMQKDYRVGMENQSL
jgi:ubiquitin